MTAVNLLSVAEGKNTLVKQIAVEQTWLNSKILVFLAYNRFYPKCFKKLCRIFFVFVLFVCLFFLD